jgi:hypothetical protein
VSQPEKIPEKKVNRYKWARYVIVPVLLGIGALVGIYYQSIKDNSKSLTISRDKSTQNNNSGNGTQTNTNISGTGNSINPVKSATNLNQLNSGFGTQNNPVNAGNGHQNNYFSPKIILTKFEKRALIDLYDKGKVEVIDSGKMKTFMFPFSNIGNVSATDFSLSFFKVFYSNKHFYCKDTIPFISKIDTIEQGVSRAWHYDFKPEDLHDTLIFYIRLKYQDIKKHKYSPKPLIFIYPTNFVNKGLTFLDYDNSLILINLLKKYGG